MVILNGVVTYVSCLTNDKNLFNYNDLQLLKMFFQLCFQIIESHPNYDIKI